MIVHARGEPAMPCGVIGDGRIVCPTEPFEEIGTCSPERIKFPGGHEREDLVPAEREVLGFEPDGLPVIRGGVGPSLPSGAIFAARAPEE